MLNLKVTQLVSPNDSDEIDADQKMDKAQHESAGSRHLRQENLPLDQKDTFLDGSLEFLGDDIPMQNQEGEEQKQSYRAAIESFQEGREMKD